MCQHLTLRECCLPSWTNHHSNPLVSCQMESNKQCKYSTASTQQYSGVAWSNGSTGRLLVAPFSSPWTKWTAYLEGHPNGCIKVLCCFQLVHLNGSWSGQGYKQERALLHGKDETLCCCLSFNQVKDAGDTMRLKYRSWHDKFPTCLVWVSLIFTGFVNTFTRVCASRSAPTECQNGWVNVFPDIEFIFW